MPIDIGVRFAHAAVQTLASDEDLDVLHIKGPAISPLVLSASATPATEGRALWLRQRTSFDADVLVRPSHAERLLSVMTEHGWSVKFRFADGSAFEHAATLVHPMLAPVDVHRNFPGFGLAPERVFDELWRDRSVQRIAAVSCPVPAVDVQRLMLIVHAARSGDLGSADIARSWTHASPSERDAVRALACRLDAEVALAAGTGELDAYRHRREYRLWKSLSSGSSRSGLWLGWVQAQPSRRRRAEVGLRLIFPRTGRMGSTLGHSPSPWEYVVALLRPLRRDLRSAAGRAGWRT